MKYLKQMSLAVIALGLMAFIIPQAQAALITERSELQMGRNMAKRIESRYQVSKDQQLNLLVVGIGRRIAAVSSRPDLQWQFKVLESKSVNAVSVPGYVYVNKGLIDLAGDDHDALAGVIAHEVAHTTARHAAERVEKQIQYRSAMEELEKRGGSGRSGKTAMVLEMLSHSRRDEHEADRLAVRYLHAAGYDPNGMLRFFHALQQQEGRKSSVPAHLRSHPTPADRIASIANEITALGIKPMPALNTPYRTAASNT